MNAIMFVRVGTCYMRCVNVITIVRIGMIGVLNLRLILDKYD